VPVFTRDRNLVWGSVVFLAPLLLQRRSASVVQTIVDSAIVAAPAAKTEISALSKRKRPFQPDPMLWWSVRCRSQRKAYWGPTAVSALIGVDGMDTQIAQENRIAI
jgi:hypothetical protein